MWQVPPDAPCLGADPSLFQPDRVTPESILAPSLDYCRFCSDKPGCFKEGVRLEGWGVWGGKGLVRGKLARQPTAEVVATYLKERSHGSR